jgi:pimeloyl-ACP methyl ester carboxylesterase
VLYGHSLGALTALGLAAQMPDRIRGVVLEDPPSPSFLSAFHTTLYFHIFTALQQLAGTNRPVAEVARELGAVRVQLGAVKIQIADVRDPLFLRFTARCLADLDPATMTPVLEGQWLNDFDLEDAADAVSCPVLLLRADENQGGMLPHADADRLAGRLADCLRVDVPGCGHLIHWLDTPTLLRHVLGFLASL